MAVRQPNDIWTRTPLLNRLPSSQSEFLDSSLLYYVNRCSYKLFQSLLTSSEVNLIERLLDQYELNVASSKSITTSSSSDDAITSALLHTRFASPNSGHSAQILRCLREHSFTFHNYSTYLKTDEHQLIDDNTSVLEIRWQTALDYLSDDEKKWLAMHHTDRNCSNNFCMNSSTNLMVHINNVINSHDSHEASQRRQAFQMNALRGNGAPYMDDVDEDDDDVGQFGMDDELMNNDQMTGERKMDEMKKISFGPQFSSVFDEQSLWQQQHDTDTTIGSNINTDDDTMKKTSMDPPPDLFESHRMQQEKSASTESSFENLCSLRTNDHGNGPVLFPFQPKRSSVNCDEKDDGQEEF